MRQILLHKQAVKFIAKVPPKLQVQIGLAMSALRENIQPQDSKKLHGYEYYRIDCGEYRVIYDWSDTTVHILIIGKRNDGDVYRKLQRGM
jgi:mRNA interferase RelE/StbE